MTDDMRLSFGFPLRVAIRSDVGKIRTNNEDSFGSAWLPDGSLFVIVADGMGGHEAGEVASGLAVQVLEEVVSRDVEADPRERLYRGLLEANEAILQEGRASGTRGMGTTAVATLCRGTEVHVGLVGDSRLYHIRRGQLVWRTLDHTRVQALIEQGHVPEVEARSHPESGMLTRALGHSKMADGRPLVPDVLAEPLTVERDDALVMCSDGLHDLLEDWEIGRVVAGRDPADAAAELVRLAVERGGHDNVTVAVICAGERISAFDGTFVPEGQAELPPPPPPSEVVVDPTIEGNPEALSALDAPPLPANVPPPPLVSPLADGPGVSSGGPTPVSPVADELPRPVGDGTTTQWHPSPLAPPSAAEPLGSRPAPLVPAEGADDAGAEAVDAGGFVGGLGPGPALGPDAATQEAAPPEISAAEGGLPPAAARTAPPTPLKHSAERRLPRPGEDEPPPGPGRWVAGGALAVVLGLAIVLAIGAIVALMAGTAMFAM